MKLRRDLSGAELVKVLCREFGYQLVNQEGSHMILATEHPAHHRICVPNHPALRPGTLNGILRSVAQVKHVQKDEILARL